LEDIQKDKDSDTSSEEKKKKNEEDDKKKKILSEKQDFSCKTGTQLAKELNEELGK
jgi:hypothetical protein